jgi:hypothetical protein
MEFFTTPVLALLEVVYRDYWPWYASGSLLFGIIGWFVGGTKGHGCLGAILGLVLGPIGLIITLVIPRK